MTPKKKRIYLLGLSGIFIIIIPVLILFSSGYRLNSKFRIVKTGGIYINNNESGVDVRLNGKITKNAGLFEKNILIRELIPETYYVRVEKEGYRVWHKNVKVQEKKVEACYPLLIPLKLHPEWIPKYLDKTDKNGRKTGRKPNVEYSEVIDYFRAYNKPPKDFIPGWEDSDIKKYKLGPDRRLRKKVFIYREEERIYVKWIGSEEKRPFFIDSAGSKSVYFPNQKILSFDFFPGRNDAIVALLEDGILYAVEIDNRFEIQNIYKIAINCSSFAVKEEFLYCFSEKAMYRIDFEP
jgi:hypothetical protein